MTDNSGVLTKSPLPMKMDNFPGRSSAKTILNYLPDLLFIFDRKGRFLDAFTKDEELLHWGKDTLRNRLLSEIMPPATAKRMMDTIDLALSSKKAQIIEYEVTAGSDQRWFEGHVSLLPDSASVLWLARDITKRKENEKRLFRANGELGQQVTESTVLWEQLFKNSPEGLVLIGPRGRILQANDEFCRMFGYSGDEVIGQVLDDLVAGSPELLDEAMDLTRRAIAGQHYDIERTRIRSDGKPIPVSILSIPIIREGKLLFLYAIYRDLTQKKQAETMIRLSYDKMRKILDETILTMSAITGMRDPYTAAHQRRVALLAPAIGHEMGLPEQALEGLRVAGLVHDIGKLKVPSEILNKPGKLSPLEFRIIQQHVQASWDILKNIDFPWPVADIVYQHHERLNGSGYPRGLKGEEIRERAKILAVADIVEAMMSHRPYRPAIGIDGALQEIRKQSGILYDDRVVAACIEIFRKGFSLKGSL